MVLALRSLPSQMSKAKHPDHNNQDNYIHPSLQNTALLWISTNLLPRRTTTMFRNWILPETLPELKLLKRATSLEMRCIPAAERTIWPISWWGASRQALCRRNHKPSPLPYRRRRLAPSSECSGERRSLSYLKTLIPIYIFLSSSFRMAKFGGFLLRYFHSSIIGALAHVFPCILFIWLYRCYQSRRPFATYRYQEVLSVVFMMMCGGLKWQGGSSDIYDWLYLRKALLCREGRW